MSVSQVKVMTSVMADQKERERRSKNVLIFGVDVSSETNEAERVSKDLEIVKEIFNKIRINPDKVLSFQRFKSKPNQRFSPPILVRFESESVRNEVLAAARKLRSGGDKFAKVYINPDLTELERNVDKELRNARKQKNDDEPDKTNYRWVIKGYNLKRVPVERQNQAQATY